VTAARLREGAPSSAPTATSSKRPSRPPSSHPSARSGAGGSPRAAARSLDAIDSSAPAVAATVSTSTPQGVVPVQRPQPQAGQDGRVGDPVQHPVQQRPPRPAPELEPGYLPVHAVGDRAGMNQQRARQALAGRQQRRPGQAERERDH
jgi:hypothetical protein